MDANAEARKVKALLCIAVVALVSGFSSYTELKFLVWGTNGEARIVNCYEARKGRRDEHVAVVYQYDDAGTLRQDSDHMPIGWQPPGSRLVQIQYIRGAAYGSRIEGQRSLTAVTIFGICLLVGAGFVVKIILDERASRPSRRPAGRR